MTSLASRGLRSHLATVAGWEEGYMHKENSTSSTIVNRHVAAQEALGAASGGTPEAFKAAQKEAEAATKAYAEDLASRGFLVPHGLNK